MGFERFEAGLDPLGGEEAVEVGEEDVPLAGLETLVQLESSTDSGVPSAGGPEVFREVQDLDVGVFGEGREYRGSIVDDYD